MCGLMINLDNYAVGFKFGCQVNSYLYHFSLVEGRILLQIFIILFLVIGNKVGARNTPNKQNMSPRPRNNFVRHKQDREKKEEKNSPAAEQCRFAINRSK